MQTLDEYLESLGAPTSLFRMVETYRASGKLFTDGGVHRMVRDAALELGFWLSVRRARVVPIKKSNPGSRYLGGADPRPFPARTRYIDKGKRVNESRRLARSPIDYSPAWDLLAAQEVIDSRSSSALRNSGAAQPVELMRVGAQDLTFRDDHAQHLDAHRSLIMVSNPTRRAQVAGIWYGQRFLDTPRWLWRSDAIFAELLEEEGNDLRDAWALREAINAPPRTLAGAQAMLDEMIDQGLVTGRDVRNLMVTHVDQHRRTITIAPRPQPQVEVIENPFVRDGEAFLLPNSERHYAFVTGRDQTRLDGRRR